MHAGGIGLSGYLKSKEGQLPSAKKVGISKNGYFWQTWGVLVVRSKKNKHYIESADKERAQIHALVVGGDGLNQVKENCTA